MRAVFDSNILIDYLAGHEPAREEIARFSAPQVSIVAWMEVMVGADAAAEPAIRRFLERFDVRPVDQSIAEQAVLLRKAHRIRLPDAIIWATARNQNAILVTRNTRDFPADDPGVRVPYER